MKILARYIARDYLRYWLLCLLGLVSLVVLSSLLGNINEVFTSWERFVLFAGQTLRNLPRMVELLLPMTVLLATLFTFNSLSRTSELLAMRAAGLGLLGQLLPVFVVLVCVAALDYVNTAYLHRWLNAGTQGSGPAQRAHHWVAREDRVYYLRDIDATQARAEGVRIFAWQQGPFRLQRLDSAAALQRGTDGDGWVLHQAVQRRRGEAGRWQLATQPRARLDAPGFPNVFAPVQVDAHHLPLGELYRKMRAGESGGRAVELYRLEWYEKMAAVAVPFVLVWFAAPLAQTHFRRARGSGELMVIVLGGLAFMIADETFLILGKGGFVHPVAAAWTVNLVFLAIGTVLMLRVR